MIKVLHYGLSSNMGGIETYLHKLWDNIDKNRFHFDFIDTNLGAPCFYEEFSEMGSKFFKVTPRNVSLNQNKKDLEKIFRNEKYNILHCHLNTLSYIEPIKVALKYGCKVIIHSRSSYAPNSLLTKMLHYMNYIYILLIKDKVARVAVSEKAGKWLFGRRISYVIINNGIDINKFKFNNDVRSFIRKKMGISNKLVIGHVGAFLYPKNHNYLLKVFNNYLEYNKDAILMLVGEGPLKNDIKELANNMGILDKIIFMGIRMDISELMSSMDVLVFPSHYEGFPNVILEAQTTGLPCLISDTITNEVIITDNCFKYSIDKSPTIWARKINEIVYKMSDRDHSYTRIEDAGHSIENQINKIENLYINIT